MIIRSKEQVLTVISFTRHHRHMEARLAKLDGWMTCNFTSFSTIFQSYQDNGRVAGRFGPVPVQTLFFGGPIPFHLGGFGPILGVGCCGPILLSPFGPQSLYF